MPPRCLPVFCLVALVLALAPGSRAAAQTTEADVHVAQAIIAIDERRYDSALADLKRALEIAPSRQCAVRLPRTRRGDHAVSARW